jgi:hypothetical protein
LHEFARPPEGFVLFPVEDIFFGNLGVPIFNQNLFDQILNIFYGGDPAILIQHLKDTNNLISDDPGLLHVGATDTPNRLLYRATDIFLLKWSEASVPLTNVFQHDIPPDSKLPNRPTTKPAMPRTNQCNSDFFTTINITTQREKPPHIDFSINIKHYML